ncbi:ornithine cyclodeaminase family protein [Streptomyces lunaelactis]|uniref:ornithine cyclodeaminase family protein n=1 Tax=Streptomyces lunaelactis TaxID=1535768 RepID=UPI001584CF94|nr:ornithine cyclodeaminase family protein [Streptomyces lunaelactis]NUK07392.1 ornithine cyclodeaminase family protein [Streptomyces lunaelactis]NUL09417.1 ornithine cyclodeaminase family protein [Streptomyces lunaelactis]NUL22223.1 ornithine cyclodeaminase family protein [Streptomyces lunaelactis]
MSPGATTVIAADDVRTALPMPAAIAALQDALREGLDPETDPARTVVPVDHGQLLLMPSHSRRYAGVKLATVAPGNPALGLLRIQGTYLLLDARTLGPLALLDGVALTAIRTAAVSAAAADLLAAADAERLVVFGTGPQAHSHIEALRSVRPLRHITVVGRDRGRLAIFLQQYADSGPVVEAGTPDAVAQADLIACCTTARTPLFDGSALSAHATVVAVGSHEPDAREVDDETVRRSTVVVEARGAALREAGDVILAIGSGALAPGSLVGLAELARGTVKADGSRPRLFKSVGMAWEDLVVAGAVYESHQGRV